MIILFSVIALLKHEASSSTATLRLTYLIIGEALLNDATALVLFNAVAKESVGPNYGSVSLNLFVYFVRVIFISPLIGFALGIGAVICIRSVNRRVEDEDTTIQIAVTIACAYISFFLAQYVVGVSGVISCCAAGVIFSRFGPSLILQPKSMELIWHTLEWMANTLIFLIAGKIDNICNS